MRRLDPTRVGDLVFWSLVVLVVVLRFRILRQGGAPPTIDAGNWLAYGDSILHRGARSATIVYPPVVPLMTTASVHLFGLVNGVSTVAAISGAAPAIGIYSTLRWCRLGMGSLIPGLLVLGASAVGEAAAWGGFPQLIALGLLPITLWAFDRLARTWSTRDAMRTGLMLMLILATSHLIASVALIASLFVVTTGLLARGNARPGVGRITSRLGIVILPAVWLIPLYVTLTREIILNDAGFRHLTGLEWGTLIERTGFLFRDMSVVWWPLLVLTLATPVLLVRSRNNVLWRLSSALLIATAVLIGATREGRYLYVLTIAAGLSVALWIAILARRACFDLVGRLPTVLPTRVALSMAISAVVLGVQISGGLSFFRSQRGFYGLLSPNLVAAIEHAGASTGPEGTIAVPSLHDAPLGWWVEAITRQPTAYGVPLRWVVFADEIERATLANQLFAPPFPKQEAIVDAAAADIEVILLPTDWTFYDERAIADLESVFPDAIERLNPEAVLLFPAAALP
jgi:hypothetical protein